MNIKNYTSVPVDRTIARIESVLGRLAAAGGGKHTKEKIIAEKQCNDIREVKKYVDSGGREVLEFVQVFGKSPESSLVKGAVHVQIQPVANGIPLPPQTIRLEFAFPEGVGVKRAFEMFDGTAKAEVERCKEEQNKRAQANRIVRAAAVPQFMGPDGKPVPLKG